MIVTVKPCSRLTGSVRLPASKSYSIRAFIVAACGGTSLIKAPSDCDDAFVAMKVAKALGARVQSCGDNIWRVTSSAVKCHQANIDVGESGTALRFLLPLVALQHRTVTITGKGTLRGRPNAFLTKTLRQQGVHIHGKGSEESVPLTLEASCFRGGVMRIDGTMSSQFISALLIACPQLAQASKVMITGKRPVSLDYITMTTQMLAKVGIIVTARGRSYAVPAPQRFKGLKNFTVPSDYGLAAFLMGAAALCPSSIVLKGALDDTLIQADGHILPLLRRMGVTFTKTSRSIRMKGPFVLKGGLFSLKDCPDLVPIMAVLALFAKGVTRLTDIQHARVKESDRISDLGGELRKLGANVQERPDELIITPQKIYKSNVVLDPHHDHRLAMAFTVFGLRYGVRIKDMQCSHKSYPGFVRDMSALGAKFS